MKWGARWTLAVWLAFVALCIGVISRTEFNADLSAFLPRSPTPAQKILVDQLRDGVVSRLILIGIEGDAQAALAQSSKKLAAQLRKDENFATVNNGERADSEKDFAFLWHNRYLLSASVTPEHFSAAALHESLNDYLQMLGAPLGAMARQILPNDPSGELIHLMSQFEGQSRPSVQDDVWFSGDGKRAMLMVQTKAPGYDIDAQERAMAAIQGAFDTAAKENATSAHLLMTGPGVFSVRSRDGIRGDAMRLSMIATALVAAMLLLLYRSPRVLALGLFPVASGALAGVAAVSLGFGSVHGITLGFGVTLIGEGVDYAIYLFTQIAPDATPQSTLKRIWPTLRLGVLTSVCGFSAMLFSGFTGLAQLGLFSIAGLVVAVSTTRWVLPGLLPQGFAVRATTGLAPKVMVLVRRAPSARNLLLLLVALAVAYIAVQREPLWSDTLSSLSPVPQNELQADQQLRNDMGAPDVRHLIVLRANDRETALQQSERLVTVLQHLTQQGALAGYESPSMYFPSLQAQRARLAALPQADALSGNLRQALHGLPFRAGLFEPFLQDVAAAREQPLLDRASLQGTNLAMKVDSLLLERDGGWTAMLPLRGVADAEVIAREIGKEAGVQAIILDMKQESDQIFRDYRHEATKNSLLGGLAIVILLWISLRSPKRVFDVLAPLVAAVVVVTAWLVWSGHQLSIFHLVGLLLVVAVGSNYSLFFDRECVSDQDRERTITSLLFANASTVIGFGLLAFSHTPVLNAIGSTVALGAVLSLVFSAILIVRTHKE